MACVYLITCETTGARYIGATTLAPSLRWSLHRSRFKKGDHKSKAMQEAWNVFGSETLTFQVLRDGLEPSQATSLERHMIRGLQPALNTALSHTSRR